MDLGVDASVVVILGEVTVAKEWCSEAIVKVSDGPALVEQTHTHNMIRNIMNRIVETVHHNYIKVYII